MARKRISLTMKLDVALAPRGERGDNSYRPPARGVPDNSKAFS